MEEVWKSVKGYEGLYKVSSSGQIRSLDRYVEEASNKNKVQFKKGVVLKQKYNKVTGYYTVTLWNNNKQKGFNVHRLVAEHFLPNNNENNTVNHIDGNRLNNKVENLEWVSYSQNLSHSYGTLRRKVNRRSVYKQKLYYTKDGVTYYAESVEEASRQTNVSPTQIRRLIANGKTSRSGFSFFNFEPSVEDSERVDNN